MVTLDLSRVDKKAQLNKPSVLLVPFGPTPSHTLKPNWKGTIGQPN